MGDSDDEFGGRREKFSRERSDVYERRRDWSRERPRGWNGGPDMKRGGMRPPPNVPNEPMPRRRDFPGQPHEIKRRFSPGREADMRARKRMRGYEPGFEGGWPPAPGWEQGRPGGFRPPEEWGPDRMGGPPQDKMGLRMLTFKQWLGAQPDDITDEEAIKNYTEYKISFKRQQLQQFFIAHKEEEWFKEKYHPDESSKRELEHQKAVKWRAAIFKKLVEDGSIDDCSLDLQNENRIIRLLDSAVIFLEGGNKDDLRSLDEPAETTDGGSGEKLKEARGGTEEMQEKKEEGQVESENNQQMKVDYLTEEQNEMKKQAELYKKLVADEQKPEEGGGAEQKAKDKKKKKKRDREYRGYDDDAEGSSSSESSGSSSSDSEDEATKKKKGEEKTMEADAAETKNEEKKEESVSESAKESDMEEAMAKPRALHRTFSIFMRNLPLSVVRNDIINLCKKFPGFIRVAFSQPIDDRDRFIRRCWVTFDRSVNIKDICWNLNNIRLRDIELNPVVNRDLARRVRPISGIAQHKACARNDLKSVAKLIMHLDKKSKIWEEIKHASEEKEEKTEEGVGKEENKSAPGKNPWLVNISEFLVDETSAEEEELVGGESGYAEAREDGESRDGGSFVTIQRDPKLVQQLDRLLYYLRLVHSVDYYNASDYPNEDEMPNRCGIMHARGPIPPNKLTRDDIAEFQKRFNDKLVHILNFKEKLTKDEAAKLGLKSEEAEVEKFVTSNTQELGKDKWLCPLSGKKFKGPDYVRKHIFNKHAEKVESVRKEVHYYNNYLMDPCRPGPPEGQRPPAPGPPQGPGMHHPGPPAPMGVGGAYGGYGGPPPMHGEPGRGHYGTPQFHHRPPPEAYNNGRTYPPKRDVRAREPYAGRPIIEYRDLDAPDDADFF